MREPDWTGGGVRLYQGDWQDVLKSLPAASVHCCVTSPPYWGLRDYGTATWEGGDAECEHAAPKTGGGVKGGALVGTGNRDGYSADGQYRAICLKCGARRIDRQLGLEPTPSEYVAKLVAGFREVRRVLRDDATCWINLGDSYASQGGERTEGSHDGATGRGTAPGPRINAPGLKPKDLCGIPWRVAFALQADGWYLRSDIIWNKPNPMPESVTDRPTKSHEYLFLLTKRPKYFYDADAIREKPVTPGLAVGDGVGYWHDGDDDKKLTHGDRRSPECNGKYVGAGGRNRRSVWTIPTFPLKAAHFATFPPRLIEPCIKAGCPHKCCPVCGKGWKRVVEKERSFESGSGKAGNMPVGKNGPELQGGGETKDIRRGPCVHSKTLGFAPDCECHKQGRLIEPKTGKDTGKRMDWGPPFTPVPGVVLDPFAGSGTTCMVATQLSCHSIGIELSAEYLELAKTRNAQPALF